MTIFGDKLLGSILPTRDGPAQGHGAERVMMNAVGGPGGIRTRVVSNPDGTTTMLRTRNGMPEFSTSGQTTSQVEPKYERGFVARVQTKALGALFSPYTLAVSIQNYKLVNVTYTVLSFASTHNVAYTDTTHWHDVLTFQGNTIRVNGKKMPALVMGGFAPGAKAIPWLIPLAPPYTGLARYGDKATNTTTKRVFSVRRDEVKSFGGGGTVQTLTPTTPRTAGKAMTIGPRIDPATSKAYLGQLFFTADSWDDMGSEWGFSGAEVAMLLTAPYLTKVSSGQSTACPLAGFGAPSSSSGTETNATTFPPTPFGMSAHGVGPSANIPTYFNYYVDYMWSGVLSAPLEGTVSGPYSRTAYSGTSSDTSVCSGFSLEYSGANIVEYDIRDEHSHYNTATLNYPSSGPKIGQRDCWVVWSSGVIDVTYGYPGGITTYRGLDTRAVTGSDIPGSFVTARNYQTQVGTFSVMLGAEYLVDVHFSRAEAHGNKATIHPNLTYYDGFMGNLANPYGANASGFGHTANVHIRAGLYGNWDMGMDFGPLNSALDDALSAFKAQTHFEDETTSGVGRTNFYTATQSYVVEDDKSLSWSTKDYLLYDTTNGVFVSVEALFIGEGTSATLTILLRVKTRHHDRTQVLGDYNYTYSDLLPEVEIDTGRYAIPSPQIRAIFAPLYCEQGSFKGAHYVTALEEANGATPFHGFNFILRLKMYGDLATLNQQNDVNTEIGFVPCNLLEMLYAFVFSQAYGVAATGERYPVWYPTRFTALRGGLFTNPVRVNIRNGINADWLDTLGNPYLDDTTTELYRT